MAGLCHSVYGTESYTKQSVPLSDREELKKIIGEQAEELVYLFGCHQKKTFWNNLNRDSDFMVDDRFTGNKISISKSTLGNKITLTLANWLEQRPRAPKEYQFLRKDEFVNSKKHLPPVSFNAFIEAYGLKDI